MPSPIQARLGKTPVEPSMDGLGSSGESAGASARVAGRPESLRELEVGVFEEKQGGKLANRHPDEAVLGEARRRARDAKSWDLTPRQLCDLDLLLNGAFAPLEGFMSAAEYEGVLRNMRLPSGEVWPVPVTLDVSEAFAGGLQRGDTIALRDAEGLLAAIMEVGEMWRPEKDEEARAVYGTLDEAHPGVSYLLHRTHPVYVSGRVTGFGPILHYDHRALRDSPAELRERFRKLGWRRVVAFQTRNPLHRAHVEVALQASRACEANLLLHPVVGETLAGEVDRFTRVRCYERVLWHFPNRTTTLSLLNLAMRMAGPREAIWHAIIRKNHGCTHFIVGRDHAAPGPDRQRRPFYGPYEAQTLMAEYEDELGIAMVPFQEVVYVENQSRYLPVDRLCDKDRVLRLSGTELKRRLALGLEIPEWFTFPEIAAELRRTYPPRHLQGFTVLFTGLSGAGKSTLANALVAMLRESGDRRVTLLDGDIVRKHLSSELGFSREHRELNLRRIGFVAAEITRNGGIAVCAPIAPYAASRRELRETIEAVGGFVEVHVSTPVEVCEARDRKLLYARARAGLIKEFTGIDDPYEVPANPDIAIDTADIPPDLAAHRIFVKLESLGFIR